MPLVEKHRRRDRATMFAFTSVVELEATSADRSVLDAVEHAIAHAHLTRDFIPDQVDRVRVDLSFVSGSLVRNVSPAANERRYGADRMPQGTAFGMGAHCWLPLRDWRAGVRHCLRRAAASVPKGEPDDTPHGRHEGSRKSAEAALSWAPIRETWFSSRTGASGVVAQAPA
jgi:hypothetical protein